MHCSCICKDCDRSRRKLSPSWHMFNTELVASREMRMFLLHAELLTVRSQQRSGAWVRRESGGKGRLRGRPARQIPRSDKMGVTIKICGFLCSTHFKLLKHIKGNLTNIYELLLKFFCSC